MSEASRPRVAIEDAVVCGTGGGRELRCDVFTPPAGTSNRTGVLLVHGGGWENGDRTQLRGYGILLGRIGYTCVACEYRLSGEAAWPAQLHDVKTALRWMRANSGRLGVDSDKIAVSGNSAGAHLSLMIAATANAPEFEGAGGHPAAGTEVAAAIAFYAPTNLEPRPREEVCDPQLDTVVAKLFADDTSNARIRDASPINYVSKRFPPALLITGGADTIVSPGESLRMYRALVAAGARAELHIYEGAPHGFDALPDFGRQCAGIMALFLDRHVARPRPISLPQ